MVEAQEGSRVLVVDDQNKVEVAVVKPLDVYQGLVVIESGLKEGQNVIVKGVQLVRPGQTVKTEEAKLESFTRLDSSSDSPRPHGQPAHADPRARQPSPRHRLAPSKPAALAKGSP